MAAAIISIGKEAEQMESVLSKSANGAKYLIVLQVASRGLTFVVNQILLRFISPELLGIATQLEVYANGVLFFARESLRLAIQRQRDSSMEEQTSRTSDVKQNGKLRAAEQSQSVANLAYVSLLLGFLLAPAIGWSYYNAQSSNSSVVDTPYFLESLVLYALAAVLELASEPCFVVAQQKSEYKIRAAAESCGTILRCLVTCGFMILASRTGFNVGVMPFAMGQFTFGLGSYLVYYWKVAPLAENGGFSLLPRILSPK